MPGTDAGFTAAAEALYAVPAGRFVAERTARAKAARADGDRDLAARITALPKPSASAWLVDLLVRDGGDGLDRLLELGAALRAAQADGDGTRLRELGTQRRDLLAELTRVVADRAEQVDKRPGAAALEEFQQTLLAALLDEGAATAVRTGRLVHALTADGLEPADLTDAVGGPMVALRRPAPEPDADDEAKAEAERLAAEAAERADRARRAADDAAVRARRAEESLAEQEEVVRGLRARLDEAQESRDTAEQAATTARAEEADAARAADAADAEAADLRR